MRRALGASKAAGSVKIQFTDAQTTVVGLVAIRDTQHCRVADLVFGRDELAEQTRRLNDPGFPLPAGIVGGMDR